MPTEVMPNPPGPTPTPTPSPAQYLAAYKALVDQMDRSATVTITSVSNALAGLIAVVETIQ